MYSTANLHISLAHSWHSHSILQWKVDTTDYQFTRRFRPGYIWWLWQQCWVDGALHGHSVSPSSCVNTAAAYPPVCCWLRLSV